MGWWRISSLPAVPLAALAGCAQTFGLDPVDFEPPPAGCATALDELMCADFEDAIPSYYSYGGPIQVPGMSDGGGGTLVTPGYESPHALEISTTSSDYLIPQSAGGRVASISASAAIDFGPFETQPHDLSVLRVALDGAQSTSCYAFLEVLATTRSLYVGHHCDDTMPDGVFSPLAEPLPAAFAVVSLSIDSGTRKVTAQLGQMPPVMLDLPASIMMGSPGVRIGIEGTIPKTATLRVDDIHVLAQ